jgi:pimeloyl-ACP methyl ester carboxylesterase
VKESGCAPEPIVILGHSYGAHSALTVAEKLGQQGYKVDLLATLDPITGPIVNIAGNGLYAAAISLPKLTGAGGNAILANKGPSPSVKLPSNVLLAWNWHQTVDFKGIGTRIRGATNTLNARATAAIDSTAIGDVLRHTDLDNEPSIATKAPRTNNLSNLVLCPAAEFWKLCGCMTQTRSNGFDRNSHPLIQ